MDQTEYVHILLSLDEARRLRGELLRAVVTQQRRAGTDRGLHLLGGLGLDREEQLHLPGVPPHDPGGRRHPLPHRRKSIRQLTAHAPTIARSSPPPAGASWRALCRSRNRSEEHT